MVCRWRLGWGPMPSPWYCLSRVVLVVARQAGLVTGNDRYWPNGFFADLVALFGGDSDEHRRSAELEEIEGRAAEELAAARGR